MDLREVFLGILDSPLMVAVLSVALVSFTYQVYFYLRYIRRGGQITPISADQKDEDLPAVSVVVCARNEQRNLKDYLPLLLSQDYPCYEVIVVDDSSEDETKLLLERCARQYPNLYHTFVPYGARVLSSKKLALTIGIKAAHYEYLLLTDADCRPMSKHWIREMVSGFAEEKTELVLGFSPYFEKKGLLNHVIGYDTLFNGLQYMGMARAGVPYMGVGRNMAYKRSTFFAVGGFKGLLGNRAGDDDLFVNRIATGKNTRVVSSPESLVWSVPETTWGNWLRQKRRHLSVAPQYKAGSKARLGVEPMMRGLFYASVIASVIVGHPYVMGIGLALFLLRLFIQLLTINLAASRLGLRGFGLGVVVYDIFLPLLSLYIMLSQPLRRKPLYW